MHSSCSVMSKIHDWIEVLALTRQFLVLLLFILKLLDDMLAAEFISPPDWHTCSVQRFTKLLMEQSIQQAQDCWHIQSSTHTFK